MKKFLLSLVCSSVMLTNAQAEIVARLGTSLPDSHPLTIGVNKFAEFVAEKSNGEITVKVYSNGVLGNDVGMTSMVQAGTLDFTTPSTATLAGLDDAFTIVSLPFIFKDKQDAYAALDSDFGSALLGLLEQHGLIGLTFYDHGFRQITNSRSPIKNVGDIKGLKIRVMQNKMFVDLFNDLGANPVPMPVNELFTALETKTVDAEENPFIVIDAKRFYEVQPYLTVSNHAYDAQVLIQSAHLAEKLSDEQQRIIEEAAEEAKKYQREVANQSSTQAREKIAEFVEINELSDEEIATFKTKVEPILQRYRAQAESLGLSI